MSGSNSLSLTSTQAQNTLSPDLRNTIYSALLSSHGIRNIEATMQHEMQAAGWIANLKGYITYLLRSGECTTLDEINLRVREKMNLPADTDKTNGTSNGVNGANGHKESDEYDLHVPERAVREGVRVVRRELEKVCEITVEQDDK